MPKSEKDLKVGAIVLAEIEDDDGDMIESEGEILDVKKSGNLIVDFDGEHVKVPQAEVLKVVAKAPADDEEPKTKGKAKKAKKAEKAEPETETYEVGDQVSAYDEDEDEWVPGTVTKITKKSITVETEDAFLTLPRDRGEEVIKKAPAKKGTKAKAKAKAEPKTAKKGTKAEKPRFRLSDPDADYEVGDRVSAIWDDQDSPEDSGWSPGVVTRVYKNGTYGILFDDGDTLPDKATGQKAAPPEYVKTISRDFAKSSLEWAKENGVIDEPKKATKATKKAKAKAGKTTTKKATKAPAKKGKGKNTKTYDFSSVGKKRVKEIFGEEPLQFGEIMKAVWAFIGEHPEITGDDDE